MTKTLGIDYGRSKIGLALGVDKFAEPLKVVRYKEIGLAIAEIEKIIDSEKVDKVVVGISEGEMGKESETFSLSLSKLLNTPVETYDETLSSQDAQRLSLEAGIHQKKRHQMEDAFAAAIMLQGYLDKLRIK